MNDERMAHHRFVAALPLEGAGELRAFVDAALDEDREEGACRLPRTFGGGLRAKREESQEREASLACQLLNRMLELGRPQSYPVN